MLALAATGAAGAQSLQVYTEFTRIDPFGEVVEPDRGENDPREVLSPALARNAVSGFHLVVSGPAGARYTLYVGQNPENAVTVALYKEKYVQVNGKWIPDELEPVPLPYTGTIGDSEIKGQTAQAFWMDLIVAREAPVERIKVEPQASFDDRWARYPMEARIVVSAAPNKLPKPSILLPSAASPADYSALRIFKEKLCGIGEKTEKKFPLSIREMIARDAVQDAAMASAVPREELWTMLGAGDRAQWCRTEEPNRAGPEWYLKVRDRVIGARQ